MVFVILVLRKFKINFDNIAIFIVVSFGDFIILFLLLGVFMFLY